VPADDPSDAFAEITSTALTFQDHASRDDLKIYLQRVARAGLPEVRMVTRGSTLAVFACTQAPESLFDRAATILVLRSFALASAPEPPIDATVSARSLLDRLARAGVVGLTLALPDAQTTVAWAGILPPRQGWIAHASVRADSLSAVAEEGMRRIRAALPESAGDPVVNRVRGEVWGSEIAPGLPAAAAFAAETMGFLAGAESLRMSRTHTWTRLSSVHGEVLIRQPLS